ncbi:transposable element Tcb1 transposase [Trichonephila clavipes]|nr:transposable element Tcb1 transposase [Trichonephila clavipes]
MRNSNVLRSLNVEGLSAFEHRTTGSRRRKETSAHDDLHLLRMTVNERASSSKQLTVRRSTAIGVLMSASSIRRRLMHRGLRARVPLCRILLTVNHHRLDMLPIEHVWDLFGRRLARDPCPAASKDELLLRIRQYGVLFHTQTFKICLTACHVV